MYEIGIANHHRVQLLAASRHDRVQCSRGHVPAIAIPKMATFPNAGDIVSRSQAHCMSADTGSDPVVQLRIGVALLRHCFRLL